MFHNVFLGRTGVALAAAGMLVLLGGPVKADETKCRRTIVKESAKWETAKLKILQKCHDSDLKGKLESGKNCIPGDTNIDGKTEEKLSKASDKFFDKIAKKCETADIAAIFPGGECPRFSTSDEASGCTGTVADAASATTCLQCVGEASVDAMIELAYGKLFPVDPSNKTDKNVLKCQRSIGKNLEKFYKAERKALAKCEDGVIKGKITGSCPDSKNLAKINKARQKLLDKLDKDCGKKEDLNQDDFGGPCVCPGLTIPGGANCAGAIHSRGDLADCLACVVDHRAACLSDMSADPESNSQDCQPVCGNGSIDAGESCDDGNVDDFDSCPSDCTLNACNNPGGSVTASVNLSGVPADLSALTVFVSYPDGKVRIVGSGAGTNLGQFTATNGTADLAANDVDYGTRIVETDPFFPLGNPPIQISYDICDGATPVDGDFDCWVEFAADTSANVLTGVTCSVDVP